MIIKIECVGFSPNPSLEDQVHQSLRVLSDIKPISRASLRVEDEGAGAEPFHLTLMLSMPGPDVLLHSRSHSFQDALQQLSLRAWAKLSHL
jgi:hypothetical protein